MKITPKTSVLFDVAAPVFIRTAGDKPTENNAKQYGKDPKFSTIRSGAIHRYKRWKLSIGASDMSCKSTFEYKS